MSINFRQLRENAPARITRLSPNTLVFLAIILLIVLWIGSGMIGGDERVRPDTPAPVPTVAASWSEAEEITRELVLYGDVEPDQVSSLRARTDGIVEEIVPVGTRVEGGQVVAQLSTDDRESRLARAQAQVESARRDYERGRELVEQDLAAESEVENLRAQYEAARAELRAIELEIDNTRLQAPHDGVVNRLIAETGSYVSLGGEVLEVVDNDPLVAAVQVQQADISRIRTGMRAQVRFIGADEVEGVLQFIAPIADASTRTFRVEIAVDNSDRAFPSGFSAEVTIPTGTVSAHKVSPALVRLDTQGRIGLHTVDADNRIHFVPVEVVRARADGVWLTGLPERARLVTISQGTLADGQQVEVRETPEEYDIPVGESR